jgi:NADPH:quinone reductase-like Zn-dependent oxidoreductase
MKALVLREHGGLEKLAIETDFPDPVAGEGDVVVRVRATSLNYHDIFTRRGMPGIKVPLPMIVGLDLAGEIVAVGPGVEGWAVGDRVLADPPNRVEGGLMGETMHGGLAELCRVRAHQLVRIPDDVSFEDAAALPCAYGTAVRMIETIGAVQPGEKVLILGASGGVGVCSVMLAKLAGAEVIVAASSQEKLDRLHEIGADHGINYAEEDFAKACQARFGRAHVRGRGAGAGGNGVDVVVNFTGGDTWVKSLRCLRRGGRLLTCGATAGFSPPEDIRYIWTFELQIRGSNGWMRKDILRLLDLVRSRQLKVLIDRVYSLDDAKDAVQAMEERRVFGKLVIAP